MQKDLDVYLETYNQRRPHRGRGMEGRTPHEVFKAGIPWKRTRKPSAREGGEKGSVGPDLGEAGCQVITVLVEFCLRSSCMLAVENMYRIPLRIVL